MKIKSASYYIGDGILIPGVLIERLFRRPVFYSADARCGWESQVIYKENEGKVVVWEGTPQPGKLYLYYPKTENEITIARRLERNTAGTPKEYHFTTKEKGERVFQCRLLPEELPVVLARKKYYLCSWEVLGNETFSEPMDIDARSIKDIWEVE